jgi:hypothetical protein
MARIRLILLSMLSVLAFGAVISASAPAHAWKVTGCTFVGLGKGSFEDSLCKTALAGGAWEKFAVAHELTVEQFAEVTSSGGEFKLDAGKTTELKCTAITDKGTVKAGGKDEAATITFTGCNAPPKTACKVKSAGSGTTAGTIVVTNTTTELTERFNTEKKANVLADEFKGKAAKGNEFVTLEVGLTENAGHTLEGECAGYPLVSQVTGQIAAEVNNTNEELIFPTTALIGNSLNAFGTKATLSGTDKQKIVGGGTLQGV